MRIGYTDRLWTVGGALGAIALLAVGWFFFIGPQYAQASALEDDVAVTQDRVTALQRRLGELRQQNSDLARYNAELQRDRQALPTTSGLTDFLRELQTAGNNIGVGISGLTVGTPVPITAAGVPLHALPITMTATGKSARLNQFLNTLQRVQPRAVLINSANLSTEDKMGSLAGSVSLTLSIQVYVAPGTASPSPAPSPSPSGN